MKIQIKHRSIQPGALENFALYFIRQVLDYEDWYFAYHRGDQLKKNKLKQLSFYGE